MFAPTFDNMFSGLIGALLGFLAAWCVAWWNATRAAKDSLRLQLLRLKDYEFAKVDRGPDTAREDYIRTYPDILAATLAYQDLLPFFRLGKVARAWDTYRGVPEKTKKYLQYTHNAPPDRGRLDARLNAILAAIK